MTDNLPVPRSRVPVDLDKPLADLEQAMTLSDQLSRSELVPNSLRGRPANVFHVLMTGQALGLHWTESLRVIYSTGAGQIGLRGAFLLSRLRVAGHKYSITEGPESCTFRLVRGDTEEVFEATFTVDDAVAAGLCERKDGKIVARSRDGKALPWQSWTKRMLRWRAVADGVSFGAPEVALGFEIEGAEPVADDRPEVVLTPQSPAPPEPAAGPAAAGDGQAAQAGQLAELDKQMRGDKDVPGQVSEGGLSGGSQAEPDMGGNTPPEPEPPASPESAPEVTAGEPAGAMQRALSGQRKIHERGLTALFAELGWPPGRFPSDVRRACSMFAGRAIRNVHDLDLEEIHKLSAALRKIADSNEAEHQVVVLADQVEAWREKFAETDPAGYEAYEAGS